MSLEEFLAEKKLISRWFILVVVLIGAFAGAILMFITALLGIVG